MKRVAAALMAVLAITGLTACEGGTSSGGDSYPHGVWFFPITGAGGSTTFYPMFY